MRRRLPGTGLALLEVMVALALLSLLVVGYLRLFQGGHRLSSRSQEWSDAVGYATDAMERAKDAPLESGADRPEELPEGWSREVATIPWQPGMGVLKVTVTLPGGGSFELYRLRPEGRP